LAVGKNLFNCMGGTWTVGGITASDYGEGSKKRGAAPGAVGRGGQGQRKVGELPATKQTSKKKA